MNQQQLADAMSITRGTIVSIEEMFVLKNDDMRI